MVVAKSDSETRYSLFEELIHKILLREFKNGKVQRDQVFRDSSKLNFTAADFLLNFVNQWTVVEVKGQVVQELSSVMDLGARQLQNIIDSIKVQRKVTGAILVVSQEIKTASQINIKKELIDRFLKAKVSLDIWDIKKLNSLLKKHFKIEVSTFDSVGLRNALNRINRDSNASKAKTLEIRKKNTKKLNGDGQVKFEKVVVIMADFRSYSKFVKASMHDAALINSILTRFYRRAKEIVEEHGAVFDKFIGDAVLFYWFEDSNIKGLADLITSCVSDLIGLSVKLADEWQEQIDPLVKEKGMRCGGAIGELLFIADNFGNESARNAIGDCINLAARLQSEADTNSFLISNRLRERYFKNTPSFSKASPVTPKNMDETMVWVWNFDEIQQRKNKLRFVIA
ncbi:MAG TPA: adenylate/guanylate cyclase domain-containing protein [bacterium]|jgi:class 3 adenylate cyclase|nr:adenylate/guanylate cyclase domain-containing protein [bacterium]